MIDLNLLDQAVGDALDTELPGLIWNTRAEQGTPFPYVVFQRISDTPQRRGIRGSSRLETYRYLVKTVTEGESPYEANTLQARVYAALDSANLSVPGVQVVSSEPAGGLPIPDPDGVTTILARYFEITLSKG